MALFGEKQDRFHRLNKTMDAINDRYGEFTLTRATLVPRSDMPNVIAPAWKPYGHMQTIVQTGERKKISQAVESAPLLDDGDCSPEY